jgi:hypothetical protein
VNRYRVTVSEGDGGWRVAILDPSGTEVFERASAGEEDARTFASTVEQHVSWLSEERFRRYYRLP